jgi:hypothetical protein
MFPPQPRIIGYQTVQPYSERYGACQNALW